MRPPYASRREDVLTRFPELVGKQRDFWPPNSLPIKEEEPLYRRLLRQFKSPILYLLLAACLVELLVGSWQSSLAIAFVVLLNTALGCFQEGKAERALSALRSHLKPKALLLRRDLKEQISAEELVPGDHILLESGMQVPADARLLVAKELLVDESMLTGESLPVPKDADDLCDEKSSLADQENMLFAGTLVVRGRAKAVVTATGLQTEMGKISKALLQTEALPSALESRMARFGARLTMVILFVIALVVLVGWHYGMPLIDLLMMAVSLGVSAIPEGLPLAVTVCLSLGLHQMARRKAVVRKMAAVETLGSASVICSDKTGTLTQNRMQVVAHLALPGQQRWLRCIAGYCHELHAGLGDPVEQALVQWAEELPSLKKEVKLPFEAERRCMAAMITHPEGSHTLLWKGAPEEILARCHLDLQQRKQVTEQIDGWSKKGLRILAMAYHEMAAHLTHKEILAMEKLTFAGMVALEDPPRPQAAESIQACQRAGIRVVMITGDHPSTARAIAERLGILSPEAPSSALVVGSQLEQMSEEQMTELASHVLVYARTTPSHKTDIVRALQRLGQVVAMTGDGVNDAPSLAAADIGVAMGSGSDVAKEAAHIVILDDQFSTIVAAVRRGRLLYSNIQQMILYLLTTALGGMLTVAVAIFIHLPLPLLPLQLLWINLVTDGSSTIPLAMEQEHKDLLSDPPRPKDAPLITKEMALSSILAGMLMMVGTLTLFFISLQRGDSLAHSQTIAFTTLALFQIWNVQNCRSLSAPILFGAQRMRFWGNPQLTILMSLATLFQVAAVELPWLQSLLGTTALSLQEWLLTSVVSFSIIFVSELQKLFFRHK